MTADATTTATSTSVDADGVVHDESHEPGHTAADHDSGLDTGQHDHEAEHLSDNRYVVIALILAAITALEVVASYVDLGPVFIPLLLFLMAVKFLTVVLYFMHLKFDNKIFKRLFYTGLILAMCVYVAALLTFRFFDG